jgi:hypothetical protein
VLGSNAAGQAYREPTGTITTLIAAGPGWSEFLPDSLLHKAVNELHQATKRLHSPTRLHNAGRPAPAFL